MPEYQVIELKNRVPESDNVQSEWRVVALYEPDELDSDASAKRAIRYLSDKGLWDANVMLNFPQLTVWRTLDGTYRTADEAQTVADGLNRINDVLASGGWIETEELTRVVAEAAGRSLPREEKRDLYLGLEKELAGIVSPGRKPASTEEKTKLVEGWYEAEAKGELQDIYCGKRGISTRQLQRYMQWYRAHQESPEDN